RFGGTTRLDSARVREKNRPWKWPFCPCAPAVAVNSWSRRAPGGKDFLKKSWSNRPSTWYLFRAFFLEADPFSQFPSFSQTIPPMSASSLVRVGIFGEDPAHGRRAQGCALWTAGYSAALTAAGAEPVALVSGNGNRTASDLLSGLQGLVLAGWENPTNAQ